MVVASNTEEDASMGTAAKPAGLIKPSGHARQNLAKMRAVGQLSVANSRAWSSHVVESAA